MRSISFKCTATDVSVDLLEDARNVSSVKVPAMYFNELLTVLRNTWLKHVPLNITNEQINTACNL